MARRRRIPGGLSQQEAAALRDLVALLAARRRDGYAMPAEAVVLLDALDDVAAKMARLLAEVSA